MTRTRFCYHACSEANLWERERKRDLCMIYANKHYLCNLWSMFSCIHYIHIHSFHFACTYILLLLINTIDGVWFEDWHAKWKYMKQVPQTKFIWFVSLRCDDFSTIKCSWNIPIVGPNQLAWDFTVMLVQVKVSSLQVTWGSTWLNYGVRDTAWILKLQVRIGFDWKRQAEPKNVTNRKYN